MLIGVEEIDRKYDVLGKLGEGGMGTVYRVRHRYLEELRVIKTIKAQLGGDEDLQQRFLREAQVAAKLRHPNIATIHDFSVDEDGTAYIAMEYIDGKNLRQHQKSEEPLGVRDVIEVGRQTLAALAYLHSKKFVHRDISTDNMMLTWAEGRMEVKLIDLGLAKSLHNDHQWKTKTGLVVGKVRYISPEQLNAGMAGIGIDHRSDLYSFGVVLYELLTRQFPITGDDEMSMIAGHLYRPPKSFEETDPEAKVPVALRNVILRALEKTPDDRFATATEFSQALTASASGAAAASATESAVASDGQTTVLAANARLPDPRTQPSAAAPNARSASPASVVTATYATQIDDELLPETMPLSSQRGAGQGGKPRWRALAVAATIGLALVAGGFALKTNRSPATPMSETVTPTAPAGPTETTDNIFFGANHALIIGNNNYRKLPLLETALNDARALAEVLERRYGFTVALLEDADRHQIISALWDFNDSLTGRDNLLIYYAGHGTLNGQSEYWQPIDADPTNPSNWISTRAEVTSMLKKNAARHVLVIADSCYSGAMASLEGSSPNAMQGSIRDLVKRPSRLVLTSGGFSPVLDTGDARHSLFARALLEALRENQEVVGVSRLFPAIRQTVSDSALERSGEQVPILSPIPDSLDEGGEFFFVPQAAKVG